MPARPKIPFRNRSHSGWWIFREIEYWVSNRQRKLSDSSRCRVWENTRLIRARTREEAYRKALSWGRVGHPAKTEGGEWRFAGITMLLPIYEEIEDGAEILWDDHGQMPLKRIKQLVKAKKQLQVFDDREET